MEIASGFRTGVWAIALVASLLAPPAVAQNKKDTAVIGMTLEPHRARPHRRRRLRDRRGRALQRAGDADQDSARRHDRAAAGAKLERHARQQDLGLQAAGPGVKFHNGEPFDASSVKFSFERAVAQGSVNKDKAVFNNIVNIATTDELTVILTLKNPNPDFLFQLGQTTASIVEPKSAATNNTQPVGTGPYKLESWNKGSSVVLARWDGYRDAKAVKLKRVTIRFISDTARASGFAAVG